MEVSALGPERSEGQNPVARTCAEASLSPHTQTAAVTGERERMAVEPLRAQEGYQGMDREEGKRRTLPQAETWAARVVAAVELQPRPLPHSAGADAPSRIR